MTEEFKKLMEHAEQVAVRENCLLYDLEMTGSGKGRTVRVFIDKEGEEGVSIDDCSKVSRGLDLILDVEDLIPGGAYQLEVSSPGLERPLFTLEHFKKYVGQRIRVRLQQLVDERRKLEGLLTSVTEDERVQLDCDGKTWDLALNMIDKANLVYEFDTTMGKR